MPNVAELIKDHVTLTVECVDRLYLNGYVPRLQSEGGVIGFLLHRGQRIPSPAVFGQLTAAFKAELRAWCQAQDIPWLEFKKGERKDDVVEPYRRSFINRTGAQASERSSTCTTSAATMGLPSREPTRPS